jgi:hypothetical protein
MLVLDTICYLFGEAVDSTSSIETDFSKEELFTITPLPIISEGNVNILFNEESLISLKLYDNFGRQVADVFKGKANVGLNTFGISANKLGLTSGVYYLNLNSDNLNLMKQILIIE